jgi:hypothetical protein
VCTCVTHVQYSGKYVKYNGKYVHIRVRTVQWQVHLCVHCTYITVVRHLPVCTCSSLELVSTLHVYTVQWVLSTPARTYSTVVSTPTRTSGTVVSTSARLCSTVVSTPAYTAVVSTPEICAAVHLVHSYPWYMQTLGLPVYVQ